MGVTYERSAEGLWCTVGGVRCRPDPDAGCTISYCEDGEREQNEAS